ncbi:DUF6198 family protein [Adlercreutzia sp. R21]|uniref:YczE/YyaS/YitT family protein n=1 Tax=Adlercreutzia wanghongyangiae TaxID=3111451 RepID=UPI002DBA1BEC|nr:DUF6198 family protein [Adlercreutzia sp. R21]MEC4183817.1 DUF6198 family protein [Adlercreutzia sp. R21]
MGRDRSGAPSRLPSRSFSARAALFMAGRVALMLAGIAVMALGIDVVVKADLGNSPISATPNVLSIGFPAVSFGTFMLGWQCFLVLVQVAILRREFRLVDLWQIPISVFFGVCIDGFMALIGPAEPASYVASWLWLAVGMAVLALGVVMTVVSGTVMNCGEAVVQAVVRKTGIRFGTGKVLFDLACAALACLCAFLFVGHLAGVREGTLVCAAFTGVVVNWYMDLYGKLRSAVRRHRPRPQTTPGPKVAGAPAPEEARELAGCDGLRAG